MFEDFLKDRSKELELDQGEGDDFTSFLNSRNKYFQHGDENKQYADSMKSAFQSNPDSFLNPNPTPPKPVENTIAGGLSNAYNLLDSTFPEFTKPIEQGLKGLGWLAHKAENLPGVKQIGGALSNSYDMLANQPSATFSEWGSQAQKNLGNLLTSKSGNAPLQQGLQSIIEGFNNPDAAKAQQSQIMDSRTQGMGPISKFGYDTVTGFGTSPLSLFPIAGVGRFSKVATSGDLLKATPKGAIVRPFVPPVEEVAGPTLGLPTGRGDVRYNAAIDRSNLGPNLNPIHGQGDIHTFELPEGNYTSPTRMKINNAEDSFHSAYEKVLPASVERMTPPLENQNELAKWVQGHLNDAGHNVSLNQVRELPYEDLRQLSEEIRIKLNPADVVKKTAHDMGYGKIYDKSTPSVKDRIAQDAQKQVYGVNPKAVNIARPDAFNISKTSPAAAPESKIGFSTNGPKKAKQPKQPVENVTPEQPRSAEPSPIKQEPAKVSQPITFKTSKGSTYTVDEQGRTQRNKTLHQGHDPKDVGVKDPSDVTVYVGKDEATRIGSHFGMNKEARPKVVYREDGIHLISWNAKENKWGRDGAPIPYTKTPEVGRSPIELWKLNQDPQLGTTASKVHAGNEITEIGSATKEPIVEDVTKSTNEPRVSDKVVNFFDEVEQAAKDRIAASKGRMNSLPVDLLADYAIIGASKLAKGLVKGSVRFSDWSAEMIKDFGEEIKPHLKAIFDQSKAHVKDAERQASGVAHLPGVNSGIDPLKGNKGDIASLEKALGNSAEWKDKGRILLNRETTERNFEDIMGKDAPIMKKTYIEPIHEAAAERQRFITKERNDIKDLGIKYKSADDALVQKYGEGKMTLDELKAESPENWQKVKTAAETMRAKYDKLLDQANEVLRRNSYPEVPKRKDYFPHYEEVDGLLNKLGFGFEDHTLPAEMNGVTANLKPGKNFFSNFQKRKGTETTLGAVAGFDRYIEGISKVIYQTDNIKRLRGLDKTLRETHEGTTHLSDFVANLTDYTNILAGKKSELDRSLEAGVGRNIYSAIDWMKRRVGANMIGGSVSSALTNSIPVTQLVAQTNKASVLKGLNSALQNLKGNDMIGQESNFLARRFPSDKLAMGKLDKAQNVAGALFKAVDHFTSNLVIRSKYYEGLKEGMTAEAAMKAADKFASRMMAERSEGAMPTLFNSRTFGILTQFQLEVNNQISHLFKDMPRSMSKGKYAGALAQVFIYDYIYNELYEKITGNRPAFDPIGVIKNAVEDYSNPRLGNKATENLVRNVSNNVPFLSIYTGGGRVPLSSAFPNVLGVAKGEAKLGTEILKPVKNLALPFGGGQVYKTITGFNAAKDGGVRSTNADGEDVVKYPISSKSSNMVLGSLFGKNALPETRDYYRNNNPSLTANETRMLDNAPNKEQMYNNILKNKELNSLKDKMTKISKDRSLTEKERTKKLGSLTDQYKEITTGVR